MRPALRVAHERVAILALWAIGAHGLFRLADPWLKQGLGGVLVPFATPYRPLWTGLGILAAYLAGALALTFYARRRIGARRWRSLHRLIPIAWALAAVHALGTGSDAGSVWLQAPLALTIGLCLIMLAWRWLGQPAPAAVRAAPAALPPAAVPRPPERPRLWSRP